MAHKVRLGWLVLAVILLGFIATRVVTRRRDENQHQQDENHHQQLVAAFSSIRPLPNALLVERVDQRAVAWVGETYKTSVPVPEIQAYYNRELESRGWKFEGDAVGAKDFGERISTYCRGELTASVVYAGQKAHYSWAYALRLTRAQHSCR